MVTVDSKGRIVLPRDLRERLGIAPGTEVEVRAEDGKAVVDPEGDPEEVVARMERLVAEAAASRDRPAEEMHPIAEEHAETVRRHAETGTTDE